MENDISLILGTLLTILVVVSGIMFLKKNLTKTTKTITVKNKYRELIDDEGIAHTFYHIETENEVYLLTTTNEIKDYNRIAIGDSWQVTINGYKEITDLQQRIIQQDNEL